MNENNYPSEESEQKVGTTVVGIKTNEGVVVGADKQTTGKRVLESQKIYPIHPNAVLSNAGLVMSIQDLISDLESRIKEYRIRRGRDMTVNALLSETKEKVRVPSAYSMPRYFTSMIVAGYDQKEGPLLAEVDYIGTVSQKSDYYAIGSGGQLAMGYVTSQYHQDMSLNEARDVVVDALTVAAEEGPYTGIGIDIALIDESGVELEKGLEFRN